MKISLSTLEREIVASAPQLADRSITALAKLLGRRTHQVRYALGRLVDRGVLMPQVIVDIGALGLRFGALAYTPGSGTVLNIGSNTLSVTAAATNDYNAATTTHIDASVKNPVALGASTRSIGSILRPPRTPAARPITCCSVFN